MKKLILALIMLIGIFTSANAVWVRGYYKSNGTYVNSYYRSAPHTYNSYGYRNTYNYGY